MPKAPKQADNELPTMLSRGTLQKRLSTITHALMLRAHRIRAQHALKSILAAYIGSGNSAGEPAEPPTTRTVASDEIYAFKPEMASLREQIELLRRSVLNAIPIVTLVRQLDDLEAERRKWDSQANRLKLLARAADAVEPYLDFPALVHERVSGLIETLDRDTARWLDVIYRAHYQGGAVLWWN